MDTCRFHFWQPALRLKNTLMSGTTAQPTKATTKRIITGTCHISVEKKQMEGEGEKKNWLNLFYLFIYQLFWTQACPEGMCTNGTQVPCEVPSLPNPTTRKGWPHHRGLRPLLFLNSDVGSFTSHKNKSVKVL